MWKPLRRRIRPHAVLVLVFLLARAIPAHAAVPPAPPADRGSLKGTVWFDARTPAPWVDVNVPALHVGTRTDDHGHFLLANLRPGTYDVLARLMGRADVRLTTTVRAGQATELEFRFEGERAVTTFDSMVVYGNRPMVHRDQIGTRQRTDHAKMEEFRYDKATEALDHAAGVVNTGGEIHLRGSRGNDLKTLVGGIEAYDVLGSRSAQVPVGAVSSVELVAGGVNPENGNALAGVFLITTREGGRSFGGDLRWDTDRYGDPTKTFDRYDRMSLDAGGPTSIANLTWFGTVEGTFQDGYPRSVMTHPKSTILDFIQLGNRQMNDVDTQWKLAWTPSVRQKWTLEGLANRSLTTPYVHSWSRHGWVNVTMDTAGGGAPRPRYGSWSATQRDENDVEVNLADHVPTLDDRYRQWTAAWRLTPDTDWVVEARLARLEFRTTNAVGGKEPWEYDTQSPFFWNGNLGSGTENEPYFATHGDYPIYSDSRSSAWTLKGDVTSERWERHRLKAGFEVSDHSVQNLSLTFPNGESNGLPGSVRSDYRNEYPQGGVFLHDLWRFEGLTLSTGARFDVFSPGFQVAMSDLPSGRRFKHQLSPRLGVSYPISVRDALSFHYGWTYQTVTSAALFENRGLSSTVATKGNPDLEPETDVSYQVALQHLFSQDLYGQLSLYFRDLYGLLTVRPERDDAGNQVSVWMNGDYASARGFEVSLTKSFLHHFSADAAYSYGIATGVASDPNQAQQFVNGGQLYLPISERALRWDQRHTVSVQTAVRDPGRWGVLLQWSYGSGLPFTPQFRNDRRSDPKLENSRRQPSHSRLGVSGDRYMKLWGQDLTLFMDARNVLDAQNIAGLSWGDGFNPNVNLAGGDDYAIYYTETGRAGGAYLKDVNGDNVLDWVPLHDPRVFEEGRSVRLGLALRF